ncbi:four-jointed box protein 1-like [Patiria miniata]|uniref:Uncharacterized protein n=1 Tax=Patiria miniata TaxID=46514 RepID=A0A913ZMK3_PATMI|nr:four-jointed box protein 1-like [Patiria miniata]
MSRRNAPFGGLFSVSFSLVVLLCRTHAIRGTEHAGDFRAQGRICLYVDLQQEFDRTVRAVKDVLDLSDSSHQEKLNHTIYKGLLNHVIGQSIPYPTEIQGGVPEADAAVVRELEEAGFVVLANLAKKDYSAPGGSASVITEPVSVEDDRPHPEVIPLSKLDGVVAGSPCDKISPHIEDGKNQGSLSEGPGPTSTHAQSRSCQTTQADLTRTKQDTPCAILREYTLQNPHSKEPTPGTPSIFGAQQNHPDYNLVLQTVSNSPPEGVRSSEASKPIRVGAAPEHGQLPSVNRDGRSRLVNREGVPIIEDDLYWSAEIDEATPKGVSQQELGEWKDRLSKQSVRSFEPGGLEKCGREKNRFIVLEDGTKLCARYRYPLITSMTGELYSYHLARMLGMTNLPPLHLSVATANSSFWRGQGSNFQDAEWDDGKVVMLTQWIEDLDKAFLPETLVQGPLPVTALNGGLRNLTTKELTSLLQWSDLLLFDYLIGHFDRLTINLSSVRFYNDSALLRSEVHNLVQHPHTKQLWIVDNESGLLDGYSFLSSSGSKDGLLQGELHEQLLRMTCVFRRSTADSVRALLADPEPARLLTARVLAQDPVSRGVFPEFDRIQKHAAMLRDRLTNIEDWMQECQRRNAAALGNLN